MSLNKKTQQNSLIFVFDTGFKALTRYLTSECFGHSTAIDLEVTLLVTLLQILMNDPVVNLNFLEWTNSNMITNHKVGV